MTREKIIEELNKHDGSVLSFPNRGPWGQSSYRGNCSGWYQLTMVNKYGVKKFAELFAGSGTGSDAIKDWNTSSFGPIPEDKKVTYIGADLNPNPVRPDILTVNCLTDDVPEEFYGADFTFMHPPYSSLIKIPYCDSMWKDTTKEHNLSRFDLGRMDWDKFMKELNRTVLKYFASMDSGARMGILMGDVRRGGRTFSMLCDLVKPGVIEQVLVKTQHNCMSDGRSYSNRNFFLTEHEFLLVLKKIGAYIMDFTLPRRYELDIRDSMDATWDDVLNAVMDQLGEADLNSIYSEIAPYKKATRNPNWKAKVRQRLQLNPRYVSKARGVWAVAA